MTQALVAEVLEDWRAAERLLDELPPTAPDHETVALLIADLREMYQSLTEERIPVTDEILRESRATLERAGALIQRLHATKPHLSERAGDIPSI
jgi:hypothetical protein